MLPEQNADLVRQWVAAWNAHDADSVSRLATTDFVRHDPNNPEVRGPEGERQLVSMYTRAFPNLELTIEDIVAAGDRVTIRFVARGTHQGELLGVPATGKRLSVVGIEMYRLVGDHVAEQWVIIDMLGILQQLGMVPDPGQASSVAATGC